MTGRSSVRVNPSLQAIEWKGRTYRGFLKSLRHCQFENSGERRLACSFEFSYYKHMEYSVQQGSLKTHHLPFLLFELWADGVDGQLTLTRNDQERILHCVEGNIAIDMKFLDDGGFRRVITELDTVDSSLIEQSFVFAEQNKISWIKACLHLEALTPLELWTQIRNYSLSSLQTWFDTDEGTYDINPNSPVDRTKIYCLLPILEVILQGIRTMSNLELIYSRLPDQNSDLVALFPRHLSRLELLPHENYLLQMVSHLRRTKDILEKSELGLKETKRGLYLFLSLGLFSHSKPRGDRDNDKIIPMAELEGILREFNKKCMHIFKYIGKEIGPVSMNILEKALEESVSELSPLFQKSKLLPDGRIDLQILPTAGNMLASGESQREMLAGLNEILVAEVLAVKKILGEAHETVLVENLKKIRS